MVFNLRLGDGMKTIDDAAVEVLPDALAAPVVAIAAQDDADSPV